MKIKRVLCIVGGMNAGGAETFLMKLYRSLDKEKYQMDFAVAENGYYDDEILSMGGKIFHIVPKSQGFFKNFFGITKLVKREKYKYVLRTSQHSLSAMELLAAWLGGAKVLVFRSSNSNTTTGGGKNLLIHKICKFMPRVFANVKLAPSTEAAEFMYGRNCVKKKKAFLLHNAIDLDVFKFNSDVAEKIKDEFGLNGKTVIGHIGRFNQQKNHKFLLEIFKEIKKKDESAVLLLIGKGELKEEIERKAELLEIKESIIFAGVRSDIPDILSAIDVIVFPSFYEGMPNVIIESQAVGVPSVISDKITKEADITGLVKYLSLDESAEKWADNAIAAANSKRRDTKEDFMKNKYNIESVSEDFIRLCFDKI